MKVYLVITEHDGETMKKPGETSTQIIRRERRYASENIEQVWKEIHEKPEFFGEDETLVTIHEEHPAITILNNP